MADDKPLTVEQARQALTAAIDPTSPCESEIDALIAAVRAEERAERDELWRQQKALADKGGHLPGSDF